MEKFLFVFLSCVVFLGACESKPAKSDVGTRGNVSATCSSSAEGDLSGIGEAGIASSKKQTVNIADSIEMLYNYTKKAKGSYQYTFLEFGAVGCEACKNMEQVMEEVKVKYKDKVQVRFINLMKKGTGEWADYFEVQTIPTQIILDSAANVVFRHVGYIPTEELEKQFK